jgi:hypothetical protein
LRGFGFFDKAILVWGARSKASDKQKAIKNLKKILSKMSKEELKSLFKELGLLGDDASRSPAGIPLVVAEAIKLLVAAAGAGVAGEVIKNFLKDVVKGDDDFKDITFPPHWAVIENPADKTKKPSKSDPKPNQDKKISKGEEKKLKDKGYDLEQLKIDIGAKPSSRYDIFKDKEGNLKVKPKNGKGEGEPLNINIYD